MAGVAEPRPGLVIRYAYLWRDEARGGREEGLKDRPCVIVLAVQDVDGQRIVTVAPLTHSPPRTAGEAVEVPAETKRRLGLDEARSWVVATEVNQFIWPGPDLRRVRGRGWDYGFAPAALLRQLREQMIAYRRLSVVRRGDD
jgi:hypothetical protein